MFPISLHSERLHELPSRRLPSRLHSRIYLDNSREPQAKPAQDDNDSTCINI